LLTTAIPHYNLTDAYLCRCKVGSLTGVEHGKTAA
jgi:hypothetical protein